MPFILRTKRRWPLLWAREERERGQCMQMTQYVKRYKLRFQPARVAVCYPSSKQFTLKHPAPAAAPSPPRAECRARTYSCAAAGGGMRRLQEEFNTAIGHDRSTLCSALATVTAAIATCAAARARA